MTRTETETARPDPLPERLHRVLTLTRAGLFAERLVRAFWPLWSVILVSLAALMLGFQDIAPIEVVWLAMIGAPVGALAALVQGGRRFHWPSVADAKRRLDATLPGRPVAALEDTQAIGANDPASQAVWEAHRRRMTERLAAARAVEPSLSLTRFDPFGLRYVALMVFVTAAIFGSIWRVDSIAGMAPGQADALALGPSWEGWIEPPRYTGRPALYLPELPSGTVDLPQGSLVTVRLYGQVGALTLTETVSGRIEDTGSVSDPVQDFSIENPGEIAINGTGGRVWQIALTPDTAPEVSVEGTFSADAAGELSLDYHARDDYGVRSGRALISLDLDAVDRRYGREIAPEPREALIVDLMMPITGDRKDFTEVLAANLSEHPWANLPVRLTLEVEDAVGQMGRSAELTQVLPGRRFFVPLAKAIIEERQALLWNRQNAAEVAQILRAVSHRPDGLFRAETDYMRLRHSLRTLEASINHNVPLTDDKVDEVAKALWDLAIRIEDGDLSNAMERLRRAQERLAEAIKNGASDEEIAELMQELREAMQEYMRQLAEQSQQSDDQQQAQNQQDMQTITGDQLQDMLEKLQQLMEEGRMAEAAQLLEMLRQMMENMQIAQGQQGGQGGAGQQALQGLQETLRNQQDLSDESFRDLQDQFNQGDQPGQRGQGQQGQDQQGQGQGQGQGEGQQGGDGLSLAERQQMLRDTLRQQQQGMPGNQETNEALDRAGRAMEGAEQSLRDGDIPGALDQQAEAMDALKDGMDALSEQMAQQQGQGEGQGGGNQAGQNPEGESRDPLGRDGGRDGTMEARRGMLPGETPQGRAQELQDEIRRRSTEQERPEAERDYLNRLLDRF